MKKMIDGDALVSLLREHGMLDAARIAASMPDVRPVKNTRMFREVNDFLASGAETLELDMSRFKHPLSGYLCYREHLSNRRITACYVRKHDDRVYLVRVPGSADRAKN